RHVDGDRGRRGRVVGPVGGLVGEAKPTRGVAVVGVAGRGREDTPPNARKHRGASAGPRDGAARAVEVSVGVVEVGVVGRPVDVDGGVLVGVGAVVFPYTALFRSRHVDGDRGRRGRVVGPVGGLVGEAKPTRGVAVVGVAG